MIVIHYSLNGKSSYYFVDKNSVILFGLTKIAFNGTKDDDSKSTRIELDICNIVSMGSNL